MGFLGFSFDLRDQLSFYGAYHNNRLNQAIHFVFVPAILWTVAVWLAYTPALFDYDWVAHVGHLLPACCAALTKYLVFNGSFVLLAAYAAYYVLLEPFAGLSWAALVAAPMWGLANAARAEPHAWAWAAGLHVLSWVVQVFLGHMVAEGRRPALLDSFFQSLVLAPLFVWFELLFVLGYRPRLHSEVQRRARADIAAWKQAQGAAAEPLLRQR